MDRKDLLEALSSYQTTFQEEQIFAFELLKLLRDPDCFQRTHLPGHLTGSSWILNNEKTHVVLVLHAKLSKWVQPGGHADGDEDILAVAVREAQEETGLEKFQILPSVFDIDIHTIPARKDFPEHRHYDIRFMLTASMVDPIIVSEESHDVQWIILDNLEQYTLERSVLRMRDKTFLLKGVAKKI